LLEYIFRNQNARGLFTSKGGVLEFSFSGVGGEGILIIPPGALKPMVEQEIYIRIVNGVDGGSDNILDNRRGKY
jgi:hypothetical protein